MCPDTSAFLYYIDAFKELISCKTSETASIPFTSIVEYFKIYGADDSFDDFLYIMRQMDSVYIEFENERLKKSQGKNNGSTKSSKNNSSKG
jgi:hypothetical protein